MPKLESLVHAPPTSHQFYLARAIRKAVGTILISGLAFSPAAVATDCVNGVNVHTGLACIGDGDDQPPGFSESAVAYTLPTLSFAADPESR